MKTFILSSFFLCVSILNAQITVQVSDFANANDTVRLGLANAFPIDLQNTGPNANWDFSQLTAQSQTLKEYNPIDFGSILIIATFGPIASTPYKASYFNPTTELPIDQFSAFLPVEISNLNQYTRRTNAQITSIGYSIDVQGQGVPFKSDTIETRYALPLHFNDTYTSRGYTYVDLNPATDIKFIQHRQRTSVVDGWGTIQTPIGSFPALRIRHDIAEVDSIYQTFFGAGTWIAPPAFTTTQYEWWTTGKKEFLVLLSFSLSSFSLSLSLSLSLSSLSVILYSSTALLYFSLFLFLSLSLSFFLCLLSTILFSFSLSLSRFLLSQ